VDSGILEAIGSWEAFYKSDLQRFYALLVIPIAFLAYRLAAEPNEKRAVAPEATRFVLFMTTLFAIETMVDPFATGPLLESDMLAKTIASSLIPFFFVYLGDLRVLWLAAGVANPARGALTNLRWAAGMALIVPIFAGAGFALAGVVFEEVHGQVLWILYELGFLALCIALARSWVDVQVQPKAAHAAEVKSYLRDLFGYSAAYYALWLTADLVILIGGLDLGWALRIVPNQLYYAFWVPFAYWRFFARRP
jgi:hypothetical protein